jgi:hypothetical protein
MIASRRSEEGGSGFSLEQGDEGGLAINGGLGSQQSPRTAGTIIAVSQGVFIVEIFRI